VKRRLKQTKGCATRPVIAILGLGHVSEFASTPIALILARKFEDFLLRYRAAKAIRELKERGDIEGLLRK
jgi:hypothetical protein